MIQHLRHKVLKRTMRPFGVFAALWIGLSAFGCAEDDQADQRQRVCFTPTQAEILALEQGSARLVLTIQIAEDAAKLAAELPATAQVMWGSKLTASKAANDKTAKHDGLEEIRLGLFPLDASFTAARRFLLPASTDPARREDGMICVRVRLLNAEGQRVRSTASYTLEAGKGF